MEIPEGYEKTVCKAGEGADCCSFLGVGGKGWMCLKKGEFEALIEKRRLEKTMVAMSDNCSGPPDFEVTKVH